MGPTITNLNLLRKHSKRQITNNEIRPLFDAYDFIIERIKPYKKDKKASCLHKIG